MTEPKTIPEKLDAAKNGQEFAAVLEELFTALQEAKNDE